MSIRAQRFGANPVDQRFAVGEGDKQGSQRNRLLRGGEAVRQPAIECRKAGFQLRRFAVRPEIQMNNGGDQHPEQDAQHPIPELGEVRQRSKPAEKGQRKGETNLDPGVGDTLRAGGNPRRQRQHRQGHRQQARQRIGPGLDKDD